jgi:hypothetical protein
LENRKKKEKKKKKKRKDGAVPEMDKLLIESKHLPKTI